jgi:hypothetical protein
MHLRSTEGLGLNEADILKATKVVLYAPPDIDSLAKQLAVFGTLCGAIFGEKSDLQLEMDEWITHITKFEATYRNLQNSRPLFALQLACFIDRKVQLYLGGCIEAESPEEVSSAYLSFTKSQAGYHGRIIHQQPRPTVFDPTTPLDVQPTYRSRPGQFVFQRGCPTAELQETSTQRTRTKGH